MGRLDTSDFEILSAVPILRRYALRLTRHPIDADDLVHDTLLRAIERRATYDPSRNLKQWLLAILHNLHIDQLRSGHSGRARERDFVEQNSHMLAPNQLDSVRLSQLRRAFDLLPPEQQDAVRLVAMEGLSYDEAGRVLGVRPGTVMSRLSRGRDALRRWEAGSDEGPQRIS
ncbi:MULTISPECIES: sigma-70 family RNA polymerase sigma factor [unclassified Devosia]|uniref:sigma-70 family RNA polymerase sigma factor n=1 Tax=unclassified Devosia TaxID=196773 RepID=UPI00145DBF46|nr:MULTISPECIES: sigma-70 family RNA polymerase sigma factor [unclassified Devosia]QMW61241.1 sigma-70 family RNA polymerase sigma factor [Devosia sp. MC521]